MRADRAPSMPLVILPDAPAAATDAPDIVYDFVAEQPAGSERRGGAVDAAAEPSIDWDELDLEWGKAQAADQGEPMALTAALEMLTRGWRPIPCEPGGKKPLVRWEAFRERAPTEAEVRGWFRQWPAANLAILTGQASGVTVIDLDPDRPADWSQGVTLPSDFVVRTPRGGYHVYLRAVPGLRNSAGRLAPHVDVRGDGGYVLVPPSTVNGTAYEVAEGEPGAIREASTEVLELLRSTDRPAVTPEPDAETVAATPGPFDRAGLLKRAAAYAAAVPGEPKGSRDDAGFRLAAKLRNDFGLTEAEAWPLFQAWNARNSPPLPKTELHHVFGSGGKYAKKPAGCLADTAPPSPTVARPVRPSGSSSTSGGPPPSVAPTSTLHLVTRPLSDVEPEAVAWLWPSRIPLGKLTLLAGDPGLGKSKITYEVVARVTTGRNWPDGAHGGEPGRVVVLNCEDGAGDTMRPALDAAGADVAGVEIVDGVTGGGPLDMFSLAEHVPLLEQKILELGRVRLVVIDPVSAYLGRDVDDAVNADLRRVLAPLMAMGERHGVAVLLVHHLNKSPNLKAIYRVTGSIGYIGAVRSAWLLAADEDDPKRRLLLPIKASLCPMPSGLGFTIYTAANGCGALAWEASPVTTTADEVTTPKRPGRQPKANVVELTLDEFRGLLAADPQPSSKLVLKLQSRRDVSKHRAEALVADIRGRVLGNRPLLPSESWRVVADGRFEIMKDGPGYFWKLPPAQPSATAPSVGV